MLSPVSGCNLTFGIVKIEDTVKKSVSSETFISLCSKSSKLKIIISYIWQTQHSKYVYHLFLQVSIVQILNGKKLNALWWKSYDANILSCIYLQKKLFLDCVCLFVLYTTIQLIASTSKFLLRELRNKKVKHTARFFSNLISHITSSESWYQYNWTILFDFLSRITKDNKAC